MGNLLNRCFGRVKFRNRAKYIKTRYKIEKDFTIEFDNLMDDEEVPHEGASVTRNVVEAHERSLLLNKQYDILVREQKKIDIEIDAKLNEHEDQIAEEEEAFYAAKREAARIAKAQREQEKQAKAKQNSGLPNSGASSEEPPWVDGDSDWDVAGGEDDFDKFLDSVKARSPSAQKRETDSQTPEKDIPEKSHPDHGTPPKVTLDSDLDSDQ